MAQSGTAADSKSASVRYPGSNPGLGVNLDKLIRIIL